jgi:hypothetical protein
VRPSYELATERNDRRFRRFLAWGLVGSVLVHAGVFLAWRAAPAGRAAADPSRAAAPRLAPRHAMQVIRLPSTEPVRIPSPPAPIAVRDLPRVVAPRSDGGPAVAVSLVKPAAGMPPGGGGAPPGEAVRLQPPEPRSLYPAWDPPPAVRGTSVTVYVRVDSLGRPRAPVVLSPPTVDDAFNHHLQQKVLRMSFRPARMGGRSVAAWAELTFSF